MKWGRNRSWMMIGTPITVIFYTLMFVKIGTNEAIAATLIVISYIIAKFFFSVAYVAHASLTNVLAGTSSDRGMLSGRRGTYTSAAGVLYSYMGTPLAAFFATLVGSKAASYPMLAFFLITLMMVAYFITVRFTRGYEQVTDENDKTKIVDQKISITEMLKNLFQNKSLMALIISEFLCYVANYILSASVIYYFTYVAQNVAAQATYLLFGGLIQVAGSYIASPISKHMSTKKISLIAMLGVGLFEVVTRFVGFNAGLAFVTLMAYRFFHGVRGSIFPALYADCGVYGEWKTGVNASPFIFGLSSFSSKLATLGKSLVMPIVLAFVGFSAKIDPKTASEAVRIGVLNMFVLIPGICTLVAGVILFLFYDLKIIWVIFAFSCLFFNQAFTFYWAGIKILDGIHLLIVKKYYNVRLIDG